VRNTFVFILLFKSFVLPCRFEYSGCYKTVIVNIKKQSYSISRLYSISSICFVNTAVQKSGIGEIIHVSSAHQGCIYLIKSTKK